VISTGAAPPPPSSRFLSTSVSVVQGSNAYWGEDDLSVTSTTRLSKLRVSVHVAQTGGLANAGNWSTVGDKLNISVTSDGSGVTYLFTLKPGATLSPGTYTFAAQYKHSGNRSAHADSYDAAGTAAGSGQSQGAGGYF
jgi:hypothetical protein